MTYGLDFDSLLERTQHDLFWLPEGVRVVDRPEILYLAADRNVGYLNTVLRVRAADARVPALVAEVGLAHEHVDSRWALVGESRRAAVERALSAAGYRAEHEHFAYSTAVDTFRARRSDPRIVVRRVTDADGLRACVEVSGRAFGRMEPFEPTVLAAELDACARDAARVQRFVAYDAATGEPLASAGLNSYPALRFGFLWAGGTVPEARGRGAYSALVASRVSRARELGLLAVGLYARVGTSAPIVERQGFARGGPMTYWMRPRR